MHRHQDAEASPPEARFGDRYELVRELDSGGMATVYLARFDGHAGFEKFVALKALHPHLVHKKDMVEMFLHEAQLVARESAAHLAEGAAVESRPRAEDVLGPGVSGAVDGRERVGGGRVHSGTDEAPARGGLRGTLRGALHARRRTAP